VHPRRTGQIEPHARRGPPRRLVGGRSRQARVRSLALRCRRVGQSVLRGYSTIRRRRNQPLQNGFASDRPFASREPDLGPAPMRAPDWSGLTSRRELRDEGGRRWPTSGSTRKRSPAGGGDAPSRRSASRSGEGATPGATRRSATRRARRRVRQRPLALPRRPPSRLPAAPRPRSDRAGGGPRPQRPGQWDARRGRAERPVRRVPGLPPRPRRRVPTEAFTRAERRGGAWS
jgi:hypothetical protein